MSNQSAAVKKFFDWGFAHGSDIATQLLYIPLPANVHDAIRAAWKGSSGHDVIRGRDRRIAAVRPGVPIRRDAPLDKLRDFNRRAASGRASAARSAPARSAPR